MNIELINTHTEEMKKQISKMDFKDVETLKKTKFFKSIMLCIMTAIDLGQDSIEFTFPKFPIEKQDILGDALASYGFDVSCGTIPDFSYEALEKLADPNVDRKRKLDLFLEDLPYPMNEEEQHFFLVCISRIAQDIKKNVKSQGDRLSVEIKWGGTDLEIDKNLKFMRIVSESESMSDFFETLDKIQNTEFGEQIVHESFEDKSDIEKFFSSFLDNYDDDDNEDEED